MKFDDILQHIGEFGPYQKRTFFLVSVPIFFSAFHKLGWVFLGAVPEHRCLLPLYDGEGVNRTYHLPDSVLNSTTPWNEKNKRWSRCERFLIENDSDTASLSFSQRRETCQTWVYDTTQYTSTVVTEFDLVCDRNWLRALVHSLYLVGEFLGCTFMSYLSDKFGRKKILFAALLGQGICGVLAGIFRNYYSFIFLRTLVGMFTQAMILTAFIIAVEFVGSNKRVVVGIAVNYFFTLGYFATAGLAFFIREWTYLHIALSVSAGVYVIAMRWVPESARWLIFKKRTDEAMKIIQKAAKMNNKTLPEFVLTIENEKGRTVRAIDVFWKPSVRVKVLIMCYVWFVNSAVYYGLSLNTSNLGGNDYLNFVIAASVELPAYSICIFTMLSWGRRLPACLSMGIGGIALICTVFFPADMTPAIITLAMFGKLGITMSYSIIFVYAAEIYPTQSRNVALGINSTFSRLGGMISSFIILLADYWKPLPLIILGVMSLSAGILALFLPETHGKALPDNFAEASELMDTVEEGLKFRRESKVHAAHTTELKRLNKPESELQTVKT